MRFILEGEEIKEKKYRREKIFLDHLVKIKHKGEEVLLIGNLYCYSTITGLIVGYLKLCGLKEADKLSKIDENCEKRDWRVLDEKVKSLVKQRDFLLKDLSIEVCSYDTKARLRDEGLFNLDEDRGLWEKLDLLPE